MAHLNLGNTEQQRGTPNWRALTPDIVDRTPSERSASEAAQQLRPALVDSRPSSRPNSRPPSRPADGGGPADPDSVAVSGDGGSKALERTGGPSARQTLRGYSDLPADVSLRSGMYQPANPPPPTDSSTATTGDPTPNPATTTGKPERNGGIGLNVDPPPASASAMVSAQQSPRTDERMVSLSEGTAELSLVIATKERALCDARRRIQRLEADVEAQAQRAEAAECRGEELLGQVQRERGRHSASHIRTADVEAENERLKRRLQTQERDGQLREAELRAAQQKVAELRGTHERVQAERVAGQATERQRADLCEERIEAQAEEMERLENVLAATNRSRDELARRMKDIDAELDAARRDAANARREYDELDARLRGGALVDVGDLYASQTETQRLKSRLVVAESNNDRLLQLLASTAEFRDLVKEDVLGLGYVYVGPSPGQGHGSAAGSLHVTSNTRATVRSLVADVNDARRNRGSAPVSRSGSFVDASSVVSGFTTATTGGGTNPCSRHPSQPLAASTPLISVHRESNFWIPKAAFDLAESFRAKHLPTSLPLSCFYQFFVDTNAIWRTRLDAKIRALTQVAQRDAELRTIQHRGPTAVLGPSTGIRSDRRGRSAHRQPPHHRTGSGDSRGGGSRTPSPRAAAAASAAVVAIEDGGSVTATALSQEATTLEQTVRRASAFVQKAARRGAAGASRVMVESAESLLAELTRAAAVHHRAAAAVRDLERKLVVTRPLDEAAAGGSTTHLNNSTSGDPAEGMKHMSLRLANDASGALRHQAVELQRVVAESTSFVPRVRECIVRARDRPEAINKSKCVSVLEATADRLATIVREVSDVAAAMEQRAGRLDATPLDIAANAEHQSRYGQRPTRQSSSRPLQL